MPPLAVPNFAQDRGAEEIQAAREWLQGRGLTLIVTPFWKEWSLDDVLRYVSELNPNVRFVLSGTTDRGANHAVIAGDGRILHNPSGVPLTGPCDNGYWWVEFIGKAV